MRQLYSVKSSLQTIRYNDTADITKDYANPLESVIISFFYELRLITDYWLLLLYWQVCFIFSAKRQIVRSIFCLWLPCAACKNTQRGAIGIAWPNDKFCTSRGCRNIFHTSLEFLIHPLNHFATSGGRMGSHFGNVTQSRRVQHHNFWRRWGRRKKDEDKCHTKWRAEKSAEGVLLPISTSIRLSSLFFESLREP